MQTYLYVMISRSPTGVAKAIRKVGRQTYSHSAVSLDGELRQIYAFARPESHAPLMGRLVKESLDRYTLRRNTPVPVVVFRLPVTQEQFDWTKQIIEQLYNDPNCVYNLFSVLTYPVAKGISIPNSFTCIEFVTYVLQHCGYLQEKPRHKYTPDDLLVELEQFVIYRGDVRGCMAANPGDGSYFAPFKLRIISGSARTIWTLTKRSCKRKS